MTEEINMDEEIIESKGETIKFKLGSTEKTVLIIGALLLILFIYNTGRISTIRMKKRLKGQTQLVF